MIAASAAGNGDVIITNTALLAVASGDWTRAEEALADTVAKQPDNFTVRFGSWTADGGCSTLL